MFGIIIDEIKAKIPIIMNHEITMLMTILYFLIIIPINLTLQFDNFSDKNVTGILIINAIQPPKINGKNKSYPLANISPILVQ